MIIYEDVFKKFQAEKLEYLIVGGIAANLLGMMRTTADLDILIDLESKNLVKLDSILRDLNYKIRQPLDIKKLNEHELFRLVKTKNLKAITYYKPSEISEIDIIIDSPVPFKAARKNAKLVPVGGLKLPVISIEDLIKMKEKSARAVDKFDISELKKIKRGV